MRRGHKVKNSVERKERISSYAPGARRSGVRLKGAGLCLNKESYREKKRILPNAEKEGGSEY